MMDAVLTAGATSRAKL